MPDDTPQEIPPLPSPLFALVMYTIYVLMITKERD